MRTYRVPLCAHSEKAKTKAGIAMIHCQGHAGSYFVHDPQAPIIVEVQANTHREAYEALLRAYRPEDKRRILGMMHIGSCRVENFGS